MSKNLNALYSSKSDNWRTPSYIYDMFVKERGYVDLFPYCSCVDQYGISYKNQRLFCNPPFSQMDRVVDYLIQQIQNGNHVMLLCPARTDTKWFHKLLKYKPLIYFIKGRLHFNDEKNVAPFPTILMSFYRYSWLGIYTVFEENL